MPSAGPRATSKADSEAGRRYARAATKAELRHEVVMALGVRQSRASMLADSLLAIGSMQKLDACTLLLTIGSMQKSPARQTYCWTHETGAVFGRANRSKETSALRAIELSDGGSRLTLHQRRRLLTSSGTRSFGELRSLADDRMYGSASIQRASATATKTAQPAAGLAIPMPPRNDSPARERHAQVQRNGAPVGNGAEDTSVRRSREGWIGSKNRALSSAR